MMFTDRFLLTDLGKVYPASSMAGSFFALCCTLFFIGLLTYVTPLVAQYLGSGQTHRCIQVFMQGALLSILFSPIVHAVGILLGPHYFAWAKLPSDEALLAQEYLEVVLWGNLFVFLNVVFSGFFSGVNRSKVVMIANVVALLVNVPLTYYLIHQESFLYLSGVRGAAAGTVLASGAGALVFASFLLSGYRSQFKLKNIKLLDKDILRKIFVLGGPTGLEFFLAFFAFNLAVMLFHSYGVNEGLAVTIALNWDILAIMPLWGLNIGLMSLAGRYLGARNLRLVERATFSGVKISYTIAAAYSLGFLLFRNFMVAAFLPEGLSEEDLRYLLPLTQSMLAGVSIYVFAHATSLVFLATLRASGDTRWCMWASVLMEWICCALVFMSVRIWHLPPITTWMIFITAISIYALAVYLRFVGNRWKAIRVV